MTPIRIAVFSCSLPVLGEKRGGVDRVVHDLADGLAQRGHHVSVWTYDPKPEGAVYDVHDLPWPGFYRSWLGHRLIPGYLANILALVPEYRNADVVLTIGNSLLMPLLGKPLIRVMAGSALGEALSATNPWRFFQQLGVYVQELLCGLTQTGCVAISHSTRRYNPFVRRIIPLGIDLDLFHPDPSAKTAEPSILFVGVLGGRKRGRMLLDWFNQKIRTRHPSARLMMVSPPGPEDPGVSYHHGVSPTELAELYRRAWVYATPSAYEGFGLPYVEAMASGTPVVASPNPGSREVLDEGRYGVLATDANFPARIDELLTNEDLRESLVARGLERAQSYSVEGMLDQYEELLYDLSASANPRSRRPCHDAVS
jgi:glycosyltransferase involved in cell wall biosynthesis